MTKTDVRIWIQGAGKIGHVARGRQSGWWWTLCGIVGPSFDRIDGLPRRTCRKCLKNLKFCQPIEGGEG